MTAEPIRVGSVYARVAKDRDRNTSQMMDTMLTSQAIGKMISTPMVCALTLELSRAAKRRRLE